MSHDIMTSFWGIPTILGKCKQDKPIRIIGQEEDDLVYSNMSFWEGEFAQNNQMFPIFGKKIEKGSCRHQHEELAIFVKTSDFPI